MAYSKKGSQHERELVILLDENGFAVMRAPASGGATNRELPDVLAGNGSEVYAIEAKSRGSDVVYLTKEEVSELLYFSENFGAKPLIGVRFDIKYGDPAHGDDTNPGWYFLPPQELYRTESGNYRVKKEVAIERGHDFTKLVTNPEFV